MHHSECNEGKAAANEMPSQLLPIYQDTFLTAVCRTFENGSLSSHV